MKPRQQLCRSCFRSIFPDVAQLPLSSSHASSPRKYPSFRTRSITTNRSVPRSSGFSGTHDNDALLFANTRSERVQKSERPGSSFNRDPEGIPPRLKPAIAPVSHPQPAPFSYPPIRPTLHDRIDDDGAVVGASATTVSDCGRDPSHLDYPGLHPALFDYSAMSNIQSVFGRYSPKGLQVVSRNRFVYQDSGAYVWKHRLQAQFLDSAPIVIEQEGLTTDEAAIAAYRRLVYSLHTSGILARFRRKDDVDTAASQLDHFPPESFRSLRFFKLQVYNYAAYFDTVPLFLTVRVRDTDGVKRFSTRVTLREQDIDVSAKHQVAAVAEALAAREFKAEIERRRKQDKLPFFRLSTNRSLNIDTAPGFLLYYAKNMKNSSFRYMDSLTSTGSDTLWTSQVMLDDVSCGQAVTMRTLETARVGASLTAAVELKKRHGQLYQDYLHLLKTGHGASFRETNPVDLSIDAETVDHMDNILSDVRDGWEMFSSRIDEREVNLAYSRLRSVSGLVRNSRNTSMDGPPSMKSSLRTELPVYECSDQIIETVNRGVYSVIIGTAGSGKSTQIPQLLLHDALSRPDGKDCNICCTQTRRVAAQALAYRVSYERDEELGETVGYQIANDRVLPRVQNGITYSTAEMIDLQLGFSPEQLMDKYSHIIIDEVHERDGSTDALLATLKAVIATRLNAGQPVPKVILMSATIHTDMYADYFANIDADTGVKTACPVLQIPGRMYPIKTNTLEDVLEGLASRMQDRTIQKMMAAPSHNRFLHFERVLQAEEAADGPAVVGWKSEWEEGQEQDEWEMSLALVAATVANICATSSQGAVLVFLPGMKEMKAVQKLLQGDEILGINFQDQGRFEFVLLHSHLPQSLEQVLAVSGQSRRRIILSTNIGETSITIPDVRFVVDSGKTRAPVFDHFRQLTRVRRRWASQASVMQRAGRAGRVQPGEYYGLFSRKRLERMSSLSVHQSNRQSRLLKHCLRIREMFPNAQLAEFFNDSLEPPSADDLESVVRQLKSIGALSNKDELTYFGRVLMKFPGQPMMGRMIMIGALFRCLEPMIAIAASMSTAKRLIEVADDVEDQIRASAIRSIYAQGSSSDHVVTAFAFKELATILEREGAEAAEQWAADSFLNFAAFNDMKQFYEKAERTLSRHLGIQHVKARVWNKNSLNPDVVRAVSFACLYPNVAVHQAGPMFTTAVGIDAVIERQSTANMTADGLAGPLNEYGGIGMGFPDRFAGAVCCYSDLNLGDTADRGMLRNLSVVPPLVVALLGGPLESTHQQDRDGTGPGQRLLMSGWLSVDIQGDGVATTDAAAMLVRFKLAWDSMLGRLLETMCLPGVRREILRQRSSPRRLIDGIIELICPDLTRRSNSREPFRDDQAGPAYKPGDGRR